MPSRGWSANSELLTNVRVVVVLGKVALDAYLSILKHSGVIARLADYRFGHNVLYPLEPALLCSYHPSQQNTSTGKLTQDMLDAVFLRAVELLASRSAPVFAVPLRSSPPSRVSRKR